jgi:crotonobetaine/carnitine-CoA ligase
MAGKFPEKPLLYFEDRTYSYRQVDILSNRIANALAADGVRKGTHVALMMDNKPEMIFTYFALGKLGAVAVPINTASKGEMLNYYLDQSDSEVIIADSAYLPRIEGQVGRIAAIRRIYYVQGSQEAAAGQGELPVRLFDDLLKWDNEDEPDVEVDASDLCLIMYSSGTTGRSKGSMASHCCALTHGFAIASAFDYGPEDICYVCLPLFHGNAWYCSCLPTIVSGGSIALAPRFSVNQFWPDVNRFHATHFNILGAMTNFLWRRTPDALERSHSVKQALVIPRPLAFYDAFEERFGIKMNTLYGLTDAGIISVSHRDDGPEKRSSAGRPCKEAEIEIVAPDDTILPRGEVGEIVIRGTAPWVFPTGYYKLPEATMAAWRNLWFHTGDRGYIDDEGYLYFSDRLKDAVRRRGENISCFEVEQIIMSLDGVAEVAAFPVASSDSEDELMVAVVPQDGAPLRPIEIVHFAKDNMPYFMVPRYVEIVESLPRTMTEKVEKYKLREGAEARLDQIWDREKAGVAVGRDK